jgi:predicted nucleic acid-binding Zn ribbon protein
MADKSVGQTDNATKTKQNRRPYFSSLGDILEQCIEQEKLSRRIYIQRLQQLWPEVVGGRIADFSRVIGLSGKILRVELDRPDWLTALQPCREKIISNLNQGVRRKLVEDIVFVAPAAGGSSSRTVFNPDL